MGTRKPVYRGYFAGAAPLAGGVPPGGKLAARYLVMVSNSASVAWAPLLAIWLTRSFQPLASICWLAASSGEWHWAQTRTVTSRPGPGGRALKSSCAKAGAAAVVSKAARNRERTGLVSF